MQTLSPLAFWMIVFTLTFVCVMPVGIGVWIWRSMPAKGDEA